MKKNYFRLDNYLIFDGLPSEFELVRSSDEQQNLSPIPQFFTAHKISGAKNPFTGKLNY